MERGVGGTGGKGQVLGGNQQALISPGCRDGSGSSLFMIFCCRTSTLSNQHARREKAYVRARRRKRVKACISLFRFIFQESSAVIVKAS